MLLDISSIHPSSVTWASLSLTCPVPKKSGGRPQHSSNKVVRKMKGSSCVSGFVLSVSHVTSLRAEAGGINSPISQMKKLRPRARQLPGQGRVASRRAGIRAQVHLTHLCP